MFISELMTPTNSFRENSLTSGRFFVAERLTRQFNEVISNGMTGLFFLANPRKTVMSRLQNLFGFPTFWPPLKFQMKKDLCLSMVVGNIGVTDEMLAQNIHLLVQNTLLIVQNTSLLVQNTLLLIQSITCCSRSPSLLVQNTSLRVQKTLLLVVQNTLLLSGIPCCLFRTVIYWLRTPSCSSRTLLLI